MAATPAPPASTGEWLRGGLANLLLALAWLLAPGLLFQSMLVLVWGAGRLFGFAVFLMYVGLVQAPTVHVRTAVLGVVCASALAIGTLPVLLAAGVTAVLTLLLSVDVAPWPEVQDIIANKLTVRSFFKRCELRGALQSMRDQRSVYAFHPHGILCVGYSFNGCWHPEFLQHCGPVKFLIDGNLRYKNPLFRILLDWYTHPTHGFDDAGRATVKQLMSAGHNFAIVPGGFAEATLFCHGLDRVVIKQKKGLIKLCLQHGYRIHPIYTFGESETFYAYQGLKGLRLWLAKYNIPTVAFFGYSLCPILPRPQSDVVTYVGEPLELPHIPEPTEKDVNEWHTKYIEALTALFESKKAEAGRPDAKLEVL